MHVMAPESQARGEGAAESEAAEHPSLPERQAINQRLITPDADQFPRLREAASLGATINW